MASARATETGTRDVTYNLISAAYHALQAADTYAMYIEDAEQAGNTVLVDYFTRAQDLNREIADGAKEHLRNLLRDGASGQ